jgi:hypothetical protein
MLCDPTTSIDYLAGCCSDIVLPCKIAELSVAVEADGDKTYSIYYVSSESRLGLSNISLSSDARCLSDKDSCG